MSYLFFAYSITWLLIASYMVLLGRRQKQLKKEIELFEEWKSEQ